MGGGPRVQDRADRVLPGDDQADDDAEGEHHHRRRERPPLGDRGQQADHQQAQAQDDVDDLGGHQRSVVPV
ncbi:hypothetical protein [Ornithinimicrobium kibberense]|uniref:hypothetical protein n=1 Tax=Ornithinimicrobium kibberense TaxID=282060 RepID=UPI003620839A